MANDEQRIQNLEQELLDERSMRNAAEKRSTELAERSATWQTRAEERADRIERLISERPGPLLGWLRSKASRRAPSAKDTAVQTESDGVGTRFPLPGIRSVRVATLDAEPDLGVAFDVMNRHEIVDRGSIDSADIVVIDSLPLKTTYDSEALRALLSREHGPLSCC